MSMFWLKNHKRHARRFDQRESLSLSTLIRRRCEIVLPLSQMYPISLTHSYLLRKDDALFCIACNKTRPT